jgi:hypothetical protein
MSVADLERSDEEEDLDLEEDVNMKLGRMVSACYDNDNVEQSVHVIV